MHIIPFGPGNKYTFIFDERGFAKFAEREGIEYAHRLGLFTKLFEGLPTLKEHNIWENNIPPNIQCFDTVFEFPAWNKPNLVFFDVNTMTLISGDKVPELQGLNMTRGPNKVLYFTHKAKANFPRPTLTPNQFKPRPVSPHTHAENTKLVSHQDKSVSPQTEKSKPVSPRPQNEKAKPVSPRPQTEKAKLVNPRQTSPKQQDEKARTVSPGQRVEMSRPVSPKRQVEQVRQVSPSRSNMPRPTSPSGKHEFNFAGVKGVVSIQGTTMRFDSKAAILYVLSKIQ